MQREKIITYGFENKFSPEATNKALAQFNMGPMGPREEGLYRSGKWGVSALERAGSDASEFVRGINTLWSLASYGMGELATHPVQTTKAASKQVGKYLGEKGIGGAGVDALNLLGSPYGLTTQDIQSRGLGNVLYSLPGAMWAHPGFSTLDFVLPVMGKMPTHQVGNILANTKYVPQVIKDFIPSTEVSKVNQVVNSSRGVVNTIDRNFAAEVNQALSGKGDLTQAVKNLQIPTAGKWAGDANTIKLTENLLRIAKKYNKDLVDMGVDASKGKQVATAQYILESINPERTYSTPLNTISKAMEGDRAALKSLNIQKERFNELRKEAEQLYDKGIIHPLSHRATYASDALSPGLVTDTDKALGSMADRRYGWAKPQELAGTLGRAYEGASRELRDARLGLLSMEGIAKSIGTKINPETYVKGALSLADDKVVISPNYLKDLLAQDFNKANFNSVARRVNKVARDGVPTDLWGKYSDDLYLVNKNSLRPIRNVYHKPKNGLGRWVNSLWKTAQLITPKYWLENRGGNISLNFLEGVSPLDYRDALKYKNIRPDRLKTETSYYGVLGEDFKGTQASQAARQALNTIKSGAVELDAKKFIKGTYDAFTGPWLSFESQFETLDRYANFIRQAKRLSKETGRNFVDIIKESNTNRNLYNKLMGNVNRSLGDYIGRNWAINPELYEMLSFLFPFHKYPTQGLRTLTHQAMSKPINFATKVTIPQRIGSKIWDAQTRLYPEISDERGGLVMGKVPGRGGYTILKQSDIYPLGAGAGLFADLTTDWKRLNLNPITDLAKILMFKDRYGNMASSPNIMNAPSGRQSFYRDDTGKPINKVFEGPKLGDYLSYLGAELGSLFVPAIKTVNSYGGPLAAAVTGKYWYPRYNTAMVGQLGDKPIPKYLRPFISGKTDNAGITGAEAASRVAGSYRLKVYPKQSITTTNKNYRATLKKYYRNKNRKNTLENYRRNK